MKIPRLTEKPVPYKVREMEISLPMAEVDLPLHGQCPQCRKV
jgi:hypothetical protein